MKAICSNCNARIRASQINVATDVAVCAQCNEIHCLSSLVASDDVPAEFSINSPPRGAWFRDDIHEWRIGASTRSPAAFFMVPFMGVWSGFSLGGIYGTQLAKGEFDLGSSLFGIPFLIGTIVFGTLALMTVFGRTEITVSNADGRVFTGIGPIGWTRRFDWSKVSRVSEDALGYQYSGGSGQVISLVGETKIKCASMMTEARRYFILQGLRKLQHRP